MRSRCFLPYATQLKETIPVRLDACGSAKDRKALAAQIVEEDGGAKGLNDGSLILVEALLNRLKGGEERPSATPRQASRMASERCEPWMPDYAEKTLNSALRYKTCELEVQPQHLQFIRGLPHLVGVLGPGKFERLLEPLQAALNDDLARRARHEAQARRLPRPKARSAPPRRTPACAGG